jgi:hypothetical protein
VGFVVYVGFVGSLYFWHHNGAKKPAIGRAFRGFAQYEGSLFYTLWPDGGHSRQSNSLPLLQRLQTHIRPLQRCQCFRPLHALPLSDLFFDPATTQTLQIAKSSSNHINR